MIISVASGKGGTGKTTLATSLAAALGAEAQLLDCDVEEPNCHILMKPSIERSETITLPVPQVDESKCSRCGTCGDVCRFSAILLLGDFVLTFPHMCHGCGGCMLMCPEGAISETSRELGVIENGWAGPVEFVQGRLRVGEAMSPPLIREVRKRINPDKIAILDAPPGTSCPVINTVKGTDFVILVTEPTPFGFHDLGLAVEAISPMNIPMGVAINRSDLGDDEVLRFCEDSNIPVLMEIPHDRRIAEGYARGNLLIESAPEYRERFLEMYRRIEESTSPAASERRAVS